MNRVTSDVTQLDDTKPMSRILLYIFPPDLYEEGDANLENSRRDASGATLEAFTEAEQIGIVDLHNQLRGDVVPAAANMGKMVRRV